MVYFKSDNFFKNKSVQHLAILKMMVMMTTIIVAFVGECNVAIILVTNYMQVDGTNWNGAWFSLSEHSQKCVFFTKEVSSPLLAMKDQL